jgi:hypothetical protein
MPGSTSKNVGMGCCGGHNHGHEEHRPGEEESADRPSLNEPANPLARDGERKGIEVG